MDACLADLAVLCDAASKSTYEDSVNTHQAGVARAILANLPQLQAGAEHRAARGCFLSAIGKLGTFFDRLIGSRMLAQEGLVLDRDMNAEEVMAFVLDRLNRCVDAIARDPGLTNPKKIAAFVGIGDWHRQTALQYFALRRTLEHHQDIPSADLEVGFQKMVIVVDDVEITSLPFLVKKGGQLGIRMTPEIKVFRAGTPIRLGAQDAYDLVFTMRNFLGPEIFRAHVQGAVAAPPVAS